MKTLHVTNREEWRDWLKKHHDKDNGVWLVFYKKHVMRPGISYRESLEEAICFGWIDGLKKGIDNDTYALGFRLARPRANGLPPIFNWQSSSSRRKR